MIHVASLLHDDVIDAASTRRGLRALNIAFGNKAWAKSQMAPSQHLTAEGMICNIIAACAAACVP